MKTAGKILVAAAVGTSFMTLYSYLISKKEKQEFTEPVLLNKLIDNSESLPDIDRKETHPAGWLAHYGVGVLFIITYKLLWGRALKSPGMVKGLLIGAASGVVAIIAWKLMFSANSNPPQNNRYKYYRQLFVAHLIFSVLALYGYKLPEYIRRIS